MRLGPSFRSLVSLCAAGFLSCGGSGGGAGVPDAAGDAPDVTGDGAVDVPADGPEDGDAGCPAGETLCDGECVDTASDPEHCGACGNACGSDEVCSDGTCASSCADPLVDCDGACVDLTSDPAHCGACGNACPDGTDEHTVGACEDSACTIACEEGWVDLDGEPGCEYACTFTGVDELCNGIDDNCDGAADEGFDCVFGETVLCTTTCASTGTGVCGIGCEIPSGVSCNPPVETCNGADDNCDGDADEGFDCAAGAVVACTTTCGGVGSGTCTSTCTIPTGSDCSAGTEICNGLDDNCNGETDETFPCVMGLATACTTTCGSTGTGTCSSTCTLPDPSACTPPAETCNGLDDDCTGGPDDTFSCVMGSAVSCTTDCGTTGSGLCTTSCDIPTGTGCAAGTEMCNGLDDDCNGLPDDTFPCVRFSVIPCTTTCGSTGSGSCSATCTLPDPSACTPPTEICNGLDDDCFGGPDDTYSCVRGSAVMCTTICGTTGTGTCSSSCSMPSAPMCTPPSEVCNGLDEDCVGGPDNGFPCAMSLPTSCTTTCGSTGTGVCSSTCALPDPSACTPPVETCNGLDDDCTGGPDDTFPCIQGTAVACTTSCGSTGSGACSGTCTLPPTWACTPPAEICNGIDDDCVGGADDTFACVRGLSVPCTTTCGSTGSGSCTSTCTMPSPSACTPPAEVCNGLDDDCVGGPDDSFACVQGSTGNACTTSGGLSGTADCTSGCVLGACCAPSEVCNGLDDDCTAGADDTFACVRSTTGLACTTGGGVPGTQDCTSTCTLTSCCASTETCGNGWDDDCDGLGDSLDPDCACSFNDDCTCPTDITGSGTFTGDTTAAADDFYGGCGLSGGRDVVFEMVITSRSSVTIDTNGSTFDTTLHIQSGSCGGTVVECDDDDGSGLQSMITRTLDPGTYWVVVDGYSSTYFGPYTLNVVITPAGAGDTCPSGLTHSWPGTATGSTASYLNDYSSWSCQSSSGGPDVVYELPLGVAATVTIDTIGSSFDTVLALLNSSCTEIDCDDDGAGYPESRIVAPLAAGTYYIVVDGYGGASGSYVLDVSY